MNKTIEVPTLVRIENMFYKLYQQTKVDNATTLVYELECAEVGHEIIAWYDMDDNLQDFYIIAFDQKDLDNEMYRKNIRVVDYLPTMWD